MTLLKAGSSACEIANLVHTRQISATQTTIFYLERIRLLNKQTKAFTKVLAERALESAKRIDRKIENGEECGRFAGVPFAVKNLFDIEGETTLAGSKINQANPAAARDAVLIERLEAEDAILIGALAMGEYAYDFTGENAHYGNCANPWNFEHMSGGSSSGSGAAVAAMMVPLSLGSDTNGSIRVPSSFCGLFGLKPTYGRLPRSGSFPFCDSLDHLGPIARSVECLSLSFDLMQGHDDGDHACAKTETVNTHKSLDKGCESLNIVRASGYFDCDNFPQAQRAMDKICQSLGVQKTVDIPGALEGRSAAYLITTIESSRLHLPRLKNQANDFDPDTRDRFIAGAMLPASWYIRAQQVRQWYAEQVNAIFTDADIIIAPATPCVAPKIGDKVLEINGEQHPLRPNLGYFTQPISAIGLPSCVVPTMDEETNLPIGVQIIAAPWREDLCLRVAKALENMGYVALEAVTD